MELKIWERNIILFKKIKFRNWKKREYLKLDEIVIEILKFNGYV